MDNHNLNQFKDERMTFGDNEFNWRICSSFDSKFMVNVPIFVTTVWVAGSQSAQIVQMVFGEEDTVINEQEQRKCGSYGCLYFNLTKPIKLLPHRQYYCNIKFDNPNSEFLCYQSKSLPFTKSKDDLDITFTKWSPLFERIDFKRPPISSVK